MIMIIAIVVLCGFALMSLFNGRQDGGNSITEIMLSREISQNKKQGPALQKAKQELRRDNSKKWHRDGLITYVLICFCVAFGTFGLLWKETLVFGLILGLMRVIIFNPAHNIRFGAKFLHLSNIEGSWDNFFRKRIGPAGYYFSAVGLFLISCFYLWTLIR